MGKKAGEALVQKSPAEFFADNKNIAGFDNVGAAEHSSHTLSACRVPYAQHAVPPLLQPGKSLYTSMRELVENSLDAAESINQLPNIQVTM